MSVFVNPFVSERHSKLAGFTIWSAIVLIALGTAWWLGRNQVQGLVAREAKSELAQFDRLNAHVLFAFDELAKTATAPPCSRDFIQQLRLVAFLPDGLNEMMYAPGGIVACSTSIESSQGGVALSTLGTPDIANREDGRYSLWINKRLDPIKLTGAIGTVVAREPFALIIPAKTASASKSSWLKTEAILSAQSGEKWHVDGEAGVFASATAAPVDGMNVLQQIACSGAHSYCVAARADLGEVALKWREEILLLVALIALYAIWPASVLHQALKRYWSLEQRFKRNLREQSIVCAYQPIVDLRTGKIAACEVLARWRDVDGSIVYPDKFIDVVAQSNQTLVFTKMVAERAFAELTSTLPAETRLQVNFNIFPRDLDSEKLSEAFRAFDSKRSHYPIALEILENDALSVENAQCEIEALARRGIRTYIDDFGSGYSSIHRVASLAINGIKLDRTFAMAPAESVMARMLVHVLDMAALSGRDIVVEGVETQQRLDLLIETGRVAYAQGYVISRPLSIEKFAEFLANHDPEAVIGRSTKVAA